MSEGVMAGSESRLPSIWYMLYPVTLEFSFSDQPALFDVASLATVISLLMCCFVNAAFPDHPILKSHVSNNSLINLLNYSLYYVTFNI